ncbi:MAG: glucose-1-phosphate adenylyltransferase [Succinivibrio sp.]|nr:glucose-1-phosphate adenylyltransferase [Succinivibrio sp.]
MSGGILAMILAGGEGSRLMPLTHLRSKPAVPFGGSYRIIDFVLNNFVNSGIIKIYVITQYKSQSLNQHLKHGWNVSGIPGTFIDPVPAQMIINKEWYQGTADAIYQNLTFIEDNFVNTVCVFGSDHIYKMDVMQMVDFHRKHDADLTVAAIKMPSVICSGRFGVIEIDENGRMTGFQEKPLKPKEIPGQPGFSLISLGNYIFKSEVLKNELIEDEKSVHSSHDFGTDIIPKLYPKGRVFVYDLSTNRIKGEREDRIYWRDVGSIDAYWAAHMDLLGPDPQFSLNNAQWPLHTYYPPLPPANFTDTSDNLSEVSASLISAGCEINGASIIRSVLGFRCRADDGATVEESVLLGDVQVGAGCSIRNAILDRGVQVAPGFSLGYDHEADARLVNPADKSGPQMSAGGIIVIPSGYKLGF